MAYDYNANLIAELYSTEDEDKAIEISDEMSEIGDLIFPRQIYEAYKRFKNTSISHYFVSNLTNFKSDDTTIILKEIADNTDSYADILMMINFLTNIKYFNSKIISKIKIIIENEIKDLNISEYALEWYAWYLEWADQKEFLEYILKTCFEDDRQKIQTRKFALKRLLKIDPKKYIKLYYEQYESIINQKIENILVEELSTWKWWIIPSFHNKILKLWSNRAKEILQKQLDKNKEKEQKEILKEQNEIKEEFTNYDVLNNISELRSNINKISTHHDQFWYSFFPAFEEIYQQWKPARDKSTLIGYCMVIRSLIGNFDEKIKDFNITKERASELAPKIQDIKGNINKFHLLLLDKNINVDSEIFWLRNINRIITKFWAHTDEENNPELTKILKKENLFDFYKDNEWAKLHRGILLKYKNMLEKLTEALTKKTNLN